MTDSPRNLVILGATGSIGSSTLSVVDAADGRFRVLGLTAHRRLEKLVQFAQVYRPAWIVATCESTAARFDWSGLPRETELLVGVDGVRKLASMPETDIVVAAMVGSAGLAGAWAAVDAGKRLAVANKEPLVMAGPLLMRLARQSGAEVLPVDSEHSAIFQALQAGARDDLKRIILTASGGPFRRHTKEELENVTVADALDHPNWEMGPKITVDSATMMNKALEIVEARWLFDLSPDQIDVIVHRQSVIHSMVEFKDGSIIAQLSPPDMRLPIQYALTYPQRCECPTDKLDWTAAFSLDFEPPDEERFPALRVGHEVARRGGTAGAVLNAANEAAVAGFLDGKIRYTQIVPACESVLNQHHFEPNPTLDQLLRMDSWARKEMQQWIGA